MSTLGLFDNVPSRDALNFGIGQSFQADRVRDFLDLKKADIARVADVSLKSVRFDSAIPAAVRERLEEIGSTCNMVAQAFDGDIGKTALWFKAKNPLLGDISPRDMVRLGRFDRLRRFILGAMAEKISAGKQLS